MGLPSDRTITLTVTPRVTVPMDEAVYAILRPRAKRNQKNGEWSLDTHPALGWRENEVSVFG